MNTYFPRMWLTIYKVKSAVQASAENLAAPSRDEWRWQLRALNNRIIGAATEGYRNRRDCIANMEAVTGILLPASHLPHRDRLIFDVPPRSAWTRKQYSSAIATTVPEEINGAK